MRLIGARRIRDNRASMNRSYGQATSRARQGLLMVAVALPTLLAFNLPPSPTLINQLLALALWGCLAVVLPPTGDPGGRGALWGSRPLLLALVPLLLAVSGSWGFGTLPGGLTLLAMGFVLAAGVLTVAGAAVQARAGAIETFAAVCFGFVIAGALNVAIAGVQVFVPEAVDGELIARSSLAARGVGNLRQPNHLASLLLWAAIAVVGLTELRRLSLAAGAALLCSMLFGVVLSGSRTGLLGTLLLALWGLADRRLSRRARAMLLLAPVFTVLAWGALAGWAHATGHAFGGEGRLSAGGDLSSSRFAIWRNAMAMLASEPWTGVGLGEFNLAWTLTALPDRPGAFFDHTHNLPLQLLVELGVPLGTLVLVLLLCALVVAARRAWGSDGDAGVARRTAFMIVLMIGLHSMLEYPLWYAYFLLPAAFAWGFALAGSRPGMATEPGSEEDAPAAASARVLRPSHALALAGLVMSIVAAAAVFDYRHAVAIYDPPDDAPPLEDRIARGQRSPLFGHHADYAAATAFGPPKAPLSPSQELAFKRAPHQLLDVRLMIAWSQALAAQGDLDKARWLAARIREFRNPGADEYFAPCNDRAQSAQAFQCQAPTRVVHWREFVQR
jgi:O-antigen ligase